MSARSPSESLDLLRPLPLCHASESPAASMAELQHRLCHSAFSPDNSLQPYWIGTPPPASWLRSPPPTPRLILSLTPVSCSAVAFLPSCLWLPLWSVRAPQPGLLGTPARHLPVLIPSCACNNAMSSAMEMQKLRVEPSNSLPGDSLTEHSRSGSRSLLMVVPCLLMQGLLEARQLLFQQLPLSVGHLSHFNCPFKTSGAPILL